jgi:hypothetical protein
VLHLQQIVVVEVEVEVEVEVDEVKLLQQLLD